MCRNYVLKSASLLYPRSSFFTRYEKNDSSHRKTLCNRNPLFHRELLSVEFEPVKTKLTFIMNVKIEKSKCRADYIYIRKHSNLKNYTYKNNDERNQIISICTTNDCDIPSLHLVVAKL